MNSTVVLLSGGIDSAVTLAIARKFRVDDEPIHALTFKYGQSHQVREVKAALKIARYFDIPYTVKTIPHPLLVGGVAGDPIPDGEYSSFKGVPPTYVPFRNGVFISLAAAYAYRHSLDLIAIGTHLDDEGAAYPDCSDYFLQAMTEATVIGTDGKVGVHAPLIHRPKWAVIRLGKTFDVPFELTYSCYRGGEIHCGTCPTCIERRKAFIKATVDDPTRYEKEMPNENNSH